MICFENSSRENYLTEKLLNAYLGGTIPIYWGCPNIDDYVNRNAILYLKPDHNDQDIQDLIKKIRELDTDPIKYRQMYEKPLFTDGKIPDTFNMEKLQESVTQQIHSK